MGHPTAPDQIEQTSLTENDQPSLMDDLLETSEKLYHRMVTKVQMQLHAVFLSSAEYARTWLDRELENPAVNAELALKRANHYIAVVVTNNHDELQKFIALEQDEWEKRDRKIREFVSSQPDE